MGMNKCLFCGNGIGENQVWDEQRAIDGFVKEWPLISDDGEYQQCDDCWSMQQRIESYDDGEILIRDKEWNWRTIRQKGNPIGG
jgi:hypothetical protein